MSSGAGDPEPALSRSQHRTLLGGAVLRPVLTTTVLLVAYFVLPDDADGLSIGALLVVGVVVVGVVGVWQVRQILRAQYPVVQAVEALILLAAVHLIGFAVLYYALSLKSASSFGEHLTRIDALYFSVTVFATVGFGDITAETQVARVVVTVQMIGNLVLFALGIRALTAAVQWRRRRGRS